MLTKIGYAIFLIVLLYLPTTGTLPSRIKRQISVPSVVDALNDPNNMVNRILAYDRLNCVPRMVCEAIVTRDTSKPLISTVGGNSLINIGSNQPPQSETVNSLTNTVHQAAAIGNQQGASGLLSALPGLFSGLTGGSTPQQTSQSVTGNSDSVGHMVNPLGIPATQQSTASPPQGILGTVANFLFGGTNGDRVTSAVNAPQTQTGASQSALGYAESQSYPQTYASQNYATYPVQSAQGYADSSQTYAGSYPAQTYPATKGYPTQTYVNNQVYPAQTYADDQGYPAQTYADDQANPTQTYANDQIYPAQTYAGASAYPTHPYTDAHLYPAQTYADSQAYPIHPYSDTQSNSYYSYPSNAAYPYGTGAYGSGTSQKQQIYYQGAYQQGYQYSPQTDRPSRLLFQDQASSRGDLVAFPSSQDIFVHSARHAIEKTGKRVKRQIQIQTGSLEQLFAVFKALIGQDAMSYKIADAAVVGSNMQNVSDCRKHFSTCPTDAFGWLEALATTGIPGLNGNPSNNNYNTKKQYNYG